jgi:hypothetical protein
MSETNLGTLTGKRITGKINILGTFTNNALAGPLYYGLDGVNVYIINQRSTGGIVGPYTQPTITLPQVESYFTSGGKWLHFAEVIYNPPTTVYNTDTTLKIGTITGSIITGGSINVYNSVYISSDTIYYAHDKASNNLIMVTQSNVAKKYSYLSTTIATDNLVKLVWAVSIPESNIIFTPTNAGDTGSTGSTRNAESAGTPGSTGSAGNAGNAGSTGNAENAGNAGNVGITGNAWNTSPSASEDNSSESSSTDNTTMYVIIGVVSLLIVGVVIYFTLFNKVATPIKKGGYKYSLMNTGD